MHDEARCFHALSEISLTIVLHNVSSDSCCDGDGDDDGEERGRMAEEM